MVSCGSTQSANGDADGQVACWERVTEGVVRGDVDRSERFSEDASGEEAGGAKARELAW